MANLLEEVLTQQTPEIYINDPKLYPIWDKVQRRERLTVSEGVALLDTKDFAAVGRMADFAVQQLTGKKVYFVLNAHINPTNLCVLSCKFCDFAKKPGQSDAYEMSIEQVLDTISDDMQEVHIVGGHHPTWPFQYYVDMVTAIREKYPSLQIKAFTASEIDYFHRRWKIPPERSLTILKEAGLSSMPGGGAEVFSKRVHKMLLPGKADATRWLEIHMLAHKMGIQSNCTLLYGHIETFQERVEHLLMLRELQDKTGGFLAFIPLKYQVGYTNLRNRHTSPIDDLKMIATARLMLDNIKYVKSYWVMLGESLASIGLNFGANDLDGTIDQERIAHAALADSPIGRTRKMMINSIQDAGRIPVERNALYKEIKFHHN